jgi:hypothetical protein
MFVVIVSRIDYAFHPTMVTEALVMKKPENYIVYFFPRTPEQAIHIPTLQL